MNDGKKDERRERPRKPYERPAVISDEVFETLALSCSRSRFSCPPGSGNRS